MSLKTDVAAASPTHSTRRDDRVAQRVPGRWLWAVLIWTPVLFVGGLTTHGQADHAVVTWFAVMVVFAAHIVAVLALASLSPRARTLSYGALAVQAVTTIGVFALDGERWSSLCIPLALGIGAVLPFPVAQVGIFLTATLAVFNGVDHDESWSEAVWGWGLSSVLAGATVYILYRLLRVIDQLREARQELAQTAVIAERARFSRDLHDLLGHTLSVIAVKAEAARRMAPVDASVAANHAQDVETIAREALQDVRGAVVGYRDGGLRGELRRADKALRDIGVSAVLPDESPELPDHIDAVLGWAVREGVTNVVRHARPTGCQVRIVREPAVVRLEIFSDASERSGDRIVWGTGLHGLEERIAAVGGSLRSTLDGDIFVLTVETPVTAGESA